MALDSSAYQGTPNSSPSPPPTLAVSSDDGDMSATIYEVVLSVFGTDDNPPPPCSQSATSTFTVVQSGNSSFYESGDSDDDCPLINLRTRARKQRQSLSNADNVEEPLVEGPLGSLPDRVAKLFAEIENHTASTQDEESSVNVGVTRRFTHSQANRVLAAHFESRKKRRPIVPAQTNVVGDTDVYEKDSPLVVITDKLRNSKYHVNDISAAVSTDATVVHVTSPPSAGMVLQDRIIHDLTLEVGHLTRLIKSSQARKDLLMSLISDVKAAVASTSKLIVGTAPLDDSVSTPSAGSSFR